MPNPVKGALGGMRGEGGSVLGDALSRDGAVDLAKLFERMKLAELSRFSRETLDALAQRVAEGPAKIEAAKARGAEAKKVKKAELALAQVQDEYARALRCEAEWLALNIMYAVGKDFATKLRPVLEGAVSPTMSVVIPGLVTVTLALDGPDDEPPF